MKASDKMPCEERPLKILLFGDASNLHRCLAEGLRRKGHFVTVASDGNRWMDTERDIDLSRPFQGKLGGAWLWLKAKRLLNIKLKGFDIVSVANATFPFLKPNRMELILSSLKENNTNIFVNALGPDTFYVNSCLSNNGGLGYTEWQVNGSPTDFYHASANAVNRWNATPLSSLYKHLYTSSVGTTTALYEYQVIWGNLLQKNFIGYTGIPIDTRSIQPVEIPERPDKVKLFLGIKKEHMLEKGTDRIMAAAKRVAERFPYKCSLEIVENRPYKEYVERMRNSHVVLDQLYSYTPATNALLAMAAGINTLSGGEPEYYEFIGEKELRPVINAIPDDEALYETLVDVISHPDLIRKRGLQGREFVKRHNDVDVVAERYLNFWKSRMGREKQLFNQESAYET